MCAIGRSVFFVVQLMSFLSVCVYLISVWIYLYEYMFFLLLWLGRLGYKSKKTWNKCARSDRYLFDDVLNKFFIVYSYSLLLPSQTAAVASVAADDEVYVDHHKIIINVHCTVYSTEKKIDIYSSKNNILDSIHA